MSGVVDRLLGLPGWLVLLVTGLMVFCEDAVFVGFLLPGETVAILAGVASRLGHVPLPAVLVVVVAAAVAGDSMGYELGRRSGDRLLRSRVLDRHRDRLDEARSLLARRGGSAVFLGRWVAFFRAVMPLLAGAARMRFLRFLCFNAAGGLVWGTVVVLVGYAAGASYLRVQQSAGRYSALVIAALATVFLLAWWIRRRRNRHSADHGSVSAVGDVPGTGPPGGPDSSSSQADTAAAHAALDVLQPSPDGGLDRLARSGRGGELGRLPPRPGRPGAAPPAHIPAARRIGATMRSLSGHRISMTRRFQRRGRIGPAALAGLVVLVLAACTSSPTGTSPNAGDTTAAQSSAGLSPSPSGALPRPDHVLVAIFENEDAVDIVGSRKAPYLSSLAAAGAEFTNAHGEVHPSQPNYLALFSGSTQGVDDDHCPVGLDGDNLGNQLLHAGLSFVGYSEGLPRPGFPGCQAGDYARKHNPWVDFTDLPESVNQPFSAMPKDYSQLPTVSFVVPDLCNDMHNCSVSTGDAWAKENLAPYADWAAQNNSLLIVTFDEDHGSDANHIATIVAGAGVAATTSDQRIDHYDLLRTIEDMYGLPPLGKAADAAALSGMWKR